MKTAPELDNIKAALLYLSNYDDKLSYGDQFLSDVVTWSLGKFKNAGEYFNTTGRSLVTDISDQTIDGMLSLVQTFVDYGVEYMTMVRNKTQMERGGAMGPIQKKCAFKRNCRLFT